MKKEVENMKEYEEYVENKKEYVNICKNMWKI